MGRKKLEKDNKALLHQSFLAHTRHTKASKEEGRRLEQVFLADARSPKLNILLFAGDLSRAASSRFQASGAVHSILDRAVGTRSLDTVWGSAHMTEIICPSLRCAHDLYDALLAELALPRSSHTCAFLWATPQPNQPPADPDPPSSDAPAANPP